MSAGLATRPVCIDGEVLDVEECPAVNPWAVAALLYGLPTALTTAVTAAVALIANH